MQEELFKPERRGGKRKRAGRKPKGEHSSERHRRREEVRAYWPVHVTMGVGSGVPYLRKRNVWSAIAKATIAAAKTKKIRIVHASVQRDHLHVLVEARNQYELAAGMHAFQISAAHWINLSAKRKGCVFPDRYHAHILKTPREARNALKYVLSNWRKHAEDVYARHAIDVYSTGYALWGGDPPSEPLAIESAESWLLREGWKRAGEISPYDVPG